MNQSEMTSEGSSSVDTGSFRDRDGRIYHYGNRIIRGVSAGALADFEKLRETKFYSIKPSYKIIQI